MYNIRLYDYPNGAQLRIYSRPVNEPDKGFKIEKKVKKAFIENPFEEKMQWVEVLEDKERTEYDRQRSIYSSVARTVNNIYMLSRSNSWDWFVTLTFNPEKVDSFNYDDCTKKLSKWLQNCKRVAPDMKYLVVPEKHKSGRYHFHGLFADCYELGFIDSGHKTKNDETIFNIGKYRLGWSTSTAVKDNERVTKYICKYVTKDLVENTPNKKRYWVSKNLERIKPQDTMVSYEKLDAVKQRLAPYIKHAKLSGNDIQSVMYLEISDDIDWSVILNDD